jgi:hypothetical protein
LLIRDRRACSSVSNSATLQSHGLVPPRATWMRLPTSTSSFDRHFAVIQDLSNDEAAHYVQSVIGTTDIVLGTFADPSSPAGIGAIIIKGREAIEVMGEAGSTKFSITAIPCERRELAVAALQMWGDGTIDLKTVPAGCWHQEENCK